MNDLEEESPIQQFYNDTTILITGATGFMGKCLLEKLLRSCTQIKTIYILVREKKGKQTDTRLDELFQDVLFTRLKETSEKFRDKVIAIAGDISAPNLGLTISDRSRLETEVNIVFHVAATVKFDEKLKLAMAINVHGTKEILNLCKTMDKLKSVVHVSTAYANCHLKRIDEQFYPCPISYEELTLTLEQIKTNDDADDDDTLTSELTSNLLGNWPNTYTFTKALAESLINQNADSLPLAVFRPGIVVSTWKEPIPGWIDNIYGPTGICAGAFMGLLSTICCRDSIQANIVPVDMTINALITVAAAKSLKPEQYNNNNNNNIYELPPEKALVYNYVSSVEKPLTWGEYCGINSMYCSKYPSINTLWYINFRITSSPVLHQLYMIFFHFVPAVLIDFILLLIGKPTRFVKIYKQTDKFTKILTYFCKHDWQFTNDNVQKLWSSLNRNDQRTFRFSMAELDWLDYFHAYVLGLRTHLCKDNEATIPNARRKQFRFYLTSLCLKMLFYYLSFYTFLNTMQRIFKIIF